jgi:hypothetical protein
LLQMFRQIGVDVQNDIASFPRHLTEFHRVTADPEAVCFQLVRLSDEKTLSFFSFLPRPGNLL